MGFLAIFFFRVGLYDLTWLPDGDELEPKLSCVRYLYPNRWVQSGGDDRRRFSQFELSGGLGHQNDPLPE